MRTVVAIDKSPKTAIGIAAKAMPIRQLVAVIRRTLGLTASYMARRMLQILVRTVCFLPR